MAPCRRAHAEQTGLTSARHPPRRWEVTLIKHDFGAAGAFFFLKKKRKNKTIVHMEENTASGVVVTGTAGQQSDQTQEESRGDAFIPRVFLDFPVLRSGVPKFVLCLGYK